MLSEKLKRNLCACCDVGEVTAFLGWLAAICIYLSSAVIVWILFFQGVVRTPTVPIVALWWCLMMGTVALRQGLCKYLDQDVKRVLHHGEVFLASALINIIGTNIAFEMHTRVEKPLDDLGFFAVPVASGIWVNACDTLTVLGPIVYGIQFLGLKRSERCRLFCAFFRVMSICYGLRALNVPLTSLPGPAAHCRPGAADYHPPSNWIEVLTRIGPLVGNFHTCGDLLYSGHMCVTNVSLLGYLRMLDVKCGKGWSKCRWMLGYLYLLLVATLCIAGRKHYTADVVLGILVSTLLYFHFEQGWIPLALRQPMQLLRPPSLRSDKMSKAYSSSEPLLGSDKRDLDILDELL